MTTTYSVPEISCDHCKDTIEKAVRSLGNVDNVTVDVAARTVSVVGGDDETIVTAIEEAGYDVVR